MEYADYLKQIEIETEAAVKAGWEHAKIEWRRMAMERLLEICLAKSTFTVNDFRDLIKNSPIQTHDNRAMGGLMATGKKMKWIRLTGTEIPSIVGHRVPIQIWQSLIYTGQYVNREALPQRLASIHYKFTGQGYEVSGAAGKKYLVKQINGNFWECTCENYRYSSKKICKHIIAVRKDLELKQTEANNARQGTLL